ncbi:hypothetical protein DFH06DRAFT_1166519 [Mycena polygramma]|nr:hypothetical protein DFH06DRAFT_1166519 [Mycena polygramma]
MRMLGQPPFNPALILILLFHHPPDRIQSHPSTRAYRPKMNLPPTRRKTMMVLGPIAPGCSRTRRISRSPPNA